MYKSAKVTGKYYGVGPSTLRDWAKSGQIEYIRTKGGHRRYKIAGGENGRSILYARVSSKKQEGDLARQVKFLQEKFSDYETVTDIGSGANFKRKGLLSILDGVVEGNIKIVVVSSKDRLARFGYELIQWMFNKHGTRILVIGDEEEETTQEELAGDILSIITVFTARCYGSRSYKLQKSKNIPEQKTKTVSK